MASYEEVFADIEDHYAAKQEAVEDKYAERRIDLDAYEPDTSFRGALKRGTLFGAVCTGIGGGAGAAAGALLGTPGLAIVGGLTGASAGSFALAAHNPDFARPYNRVLDGAEHIQKGWYGGRERAAKGKVKAASWADIDGLLGDEDEET